MPEYRPLSAADLNAPGVLNDPNGLIASVADVPVWPGVIEITLNSAAAAKTAIQGPNAGATFSFPVLGQGGFPIPANCRATDRIFLWDVKPGKFTDLHIVAAGWLNDVPATATKGMLLGWQQNGVKRLPGSMYGAAGAVPTGMVVGTASQAQHRGVEVACTRHGRDGSFRMLPAVAAECDGAGIPTLYIDASAERNWGCEWAQMQRAIFIGAQAALAGATTLRLSICIGMDGDGIPRRFPSPVFGPDAPTNVLLYGDSTFWGNPSTEPWAHRYLEGLYLRSAVGTEHLPRFVGTEHGGSPINFILGRYQTNTKSGRTAAYYAANAAAQAAALAALGPSERPDRLIVCIGVNDLARAPALIAADIQTGNDAYAAQFPGLPIDYIIPPPVPATAPGYAALVAFRAYLLANPLTGCTTTDPNSGVPYASGWYQDPASNNYHPKLEATLTDTPDYSHGMWDFTRLVYKILHGGADPT